MYAKSVIFEVSYPFMLFTNITSPHSKFCVNLIMATIFESTRVTDHVGGLGAFYILVVP